MTLFEITDCIIYAQQGIVDCRTIPRTPFGINYQHEVRPAVQAIMNVYADRHEGWKGCGMVHAFNLSDMLHTEARAEVVKEAKRRGYRPEGWGFDPVLTAIRLRGDEGTPLFDLDKALGEYYMQRFDP